jgi:hypothetical protein
MDDVTYPLPAPESPEQLERNLRVIERDLGLTRDQILADAQRFARGETLPDIYVRDDKGYFYTMLACNLGFKSEAELWAERCSTLADNLLFFLDNGQLSRAGLVALVQGISRAWMHRTEWTNPHAGTPLEQTSHFLCGTIHTAFDLGQGTSVLATVPMTCALIEAGEQTPVDLMQLLYDTIATGIAAEYDDEAHDEADDDGS